MVTNLCAPCAKNAADIVNAGNRKRKHLDPRHLNHIVGGLDKGSAQQKMGRREDKL